MCAATVPHRFSLSLRGCGAPKADSGSARRVLGVVIRGEVQVPDPLVYCGEGLLVSGGVVRAAQWSAGTLVRLAVPLPADVLSGREGVIATQ